MRLIKLHRVLVVGGAALVASCGNADDSQDQTVTNLTDAAPNDDGAQPSNDAAPKTDGKGVDAWLSWVTTDPPVTTTDARTPLEDAADATEGDAGSAADASPEDARGVDAWLSWA